MLVLDIEEESIEAAVLVESKIVMRISACE
jgi:hypothetical protein